MASPRVKPPTRRAHKDLHVRVDPEIAEAVATLAQKEHRSLGRQIELMLEAYLRETRYRNAFNPSKEDRPS